MSDIKVARFQISPKSWVPWGGEAVTDLIKAKYMGIPFYISRFFSPGT